MTGSKALLTPDRMEEVSALLSSHGVDAWLLYDFHDQNPLAHRLLGLGKTTRQAFALFPRRGHPILLRHAIEASPWSRWPWESREYHGWRELIQGLRDLLSSLEVVAMEVSENGAIPAVDRVPLGVVDMVRATGVSVTSSMNLVTAFHARWSNEGLKLHRVAAEVVRAIALVAFQKAAEAASGRTPILEVELMEWIRTELRANGLTDQEDCIVAGGEHSSDAHYEPVGHGAPLEEGSVVLIDLWGRHPDGGIHADQTWMGFLGQRPSDRLVEVWSAVREARDAALGFLSGRAAKGESVRGWEVDEVARRTLARRELDLYFIHRLGHSIDRDLHGSGPNLDDLETREERRLLPGVGFSVEPGVYIPGELGVRSEVNVHWGADGPEVTPQEIQDELLLSTET